MVNNIRWLISGLLILIGLEYGKAQNYNINRNWLFVKDQSKSITVNSLPMAEMHTIQLPHTFNGKDMYDDIPGYYRGAVWYYKKLQLPYFDAAKSYLLKVNAANQKADVFLNGKKVGSHIGGYSAFVFDLTKHLKPGLEQNLAIRVSNEFDDHIAPLSADFSFWGGLYRSVELIVKPQVMLDQLNAGCQANYIHIQNITESKAEVVIKTIIRNSSAFSQSVNVKQTILDSKDIVISSKFQELLLDAMEVDTIDQTFIIKAPELWHPNEPKLYALKSEIIKSGQIQDSEVTTFGIRYFSFNGEGLTLNGEKLIMNGVNRHQEYGMDGWALPSYRHIQDAIAIKDNGFNYVRLAHYPQDQIMLDACDQLGLIIWEEIPLVDYITDSEAFSKNAETMLKEMIMQHYNHPSVFIWGLMNEIFIREGKDREGEDQDQRIRATVRLASRLNKLAKSLDPSRATGLTGEFKPYYNSSGLADITDVMGWNLYFGWYYGQWDDFGSFLDEEHRQYPNRALIVTEYGAGADPRISSDKPKNFDFSQEYQTKMLDSYQRQIKNRDYLAGASVWVYNDFTSEKRGDAVPHINSKGLVSMYRKPKLAWESWNSSNSNEELLIIDRNQLLDINSDSVDIVAEIKLPQNIVKKIKEQSINVKPAIAINLGTDNTFYDNESHCLYIPMSSLITTSLEVVGGERIRFSTWFGEIEGNDCNVKNTNVDPFYQTGIKGVESIKMQLSPGLYQLEMFWADCLNLESAMEIRVNKKLVLANVCPAKEVGLYTAMKKCFQVHHEGGVLEIEIRAIENETFLNGLSVRKN